MPHASTWFQAVWSAANSLTFGVRNLVRWRVPILLDRPAPAGPLFPYLADPAGALGKVRAWEERYGIDPRGLAPEIETVRDALFMLGMLEAALDDVGVRLPDPAAVLDIGAKNWHYVRALWALLERYERPERSERPEWSGAERGGGHEVRPDWRSAVRREVRLTGIEIDPFVVYRDGHSRYDWARLYARPLPAATYVAGDALAHNGEYDLVLLLFPIMQETEHLDWGLPLERYRPAELIGHAYRLARPGGTLVITCYDYEHEDLLAALDSQRMVPVVARPHVSDLADYDIGRFVTVFRR